MHIIMWVRVSDSICRMDSNTWGPGDERGGDIQCFQHTSAVSQPNNNSVQMGGSTRCYGERQRSANHPGTRSEKLHHQSQTRKTELQRELDVVDRLGALHQVTAPMIADVCGSLVVAFNVVVLYGNVELH